MNNIIEMGNITKKSLENKSLDMQVIGSIAIMMERNKKLEELLKEKRILVYEGEEWIITEIKNFWITLTLSEDLINFKRGDSRTLKLDINKIWNEVGVTRYHLVENKTTLTEITLKIRDIRRAYIKFNASFKAGANPKDCHCFRCKRKFENNEFLNMIIFEDEEIEARFVCNDCC